MQQLRVPIRVVFYQDEGVWVAHCLEFDLLGDGPSRAEALHKLSQAIRLQVEATLDYGNPANLFSPADGEYFRMFAAGEDVAEGELRLQFDPMDEINIEDVELREFNEAAPAAV
jgi:predicted RNase H-like HicB family nuclease